MTANKAAHRGREKVNQSGGYRHPSGLSGRRIQRFRSIRALSNVSFAERRASSRWGTRNRNGRSSTSGWRSASCTRRSWSRMRSPSCSAPISASLRNLLPHEHTIKDSHENTFDAQDESDPVIEDLEVSLAALREGAPCRCRESRQHRGAGDLR